MEGLGAIFAMESLDQDDIRVAPRSTLDGIVLRVTEPRVELWRLEAVGCENYLRATASDGLRFCCSQQRTPEPLIAMVFADPEVRDLATTTPSVATQTGEDLARLVAYVGAQEPSVEIACSISVELVDALGEKLLQLVALGLVERNDRGGFQWGLTFDMSGGAKGAKRPLGRPLDGGVRRLSVSAQLDRRAPHAEFLRAAPALEFADRQPSCPRQHYFRSVESAPPRDWPPTFR